jgi:hypothetical protein
MTTLILKKCSKCGEEKPINQFGMDRKSIRSRCKKCHSKIQIIYLRENKEIAIRHSKRNYPNQFLKIKDNILKLKDSYINNLFLKLSKNVLHYNEIPQELIEIKRLQLTLHRLIKKLDT